MDGNVVIIDYGMGNVASLQNMVKKIGGNAVIHSDPDQVLKAKKLILPGVGAFDHAMKRLQDLHLLEPLREVVLKKGVPILCICLGCQLLTRRSEEGILPGLGWIDAETVRFSFSPPTMLRIPHMGWNRVTPKKPSRLLKGLEDGARFYFVHSYHLVCKDKKDVLTTSHYGYEFVSAVERDNIFGTQFHPEKSHRYGLQMIRNFYEL